MGRVGFVLVLMALALVVGSGVAVAAMERSMHSRSPKADKKRREKQENGYTAR